jgi:DNA mismatch repair protein MutS
VIFLHRIVEGGTDRSYGIHVARLAGIPREVLERASQLLGELAVQHVGRPTISRAAKSQRLRETNQLPLFVDPAQQLRDELAAVKIDELTPMQAFDLLRQLKQKYKLG